MALTYDAIKEAIQMYQHTTLTPFVLLHTREGRVLRRFQDGTNAEAIERARDAIHNEDQATQAYALLYDAFIEDDGHDVDAFIVEVGERHRAYGVRFAQRYRQDAPDRAPQLRGHLAYLGQIDSYLA